MGVLGLVGWWEEEEYEREIERIEGEGDGGELEVAEKDVSRERQTYGVNNMSPG